MPTVHAGGDTAGIKFSVKNMKVVSSPVEEENNFDVEITYHAKLTNVCWIETVWNSCGSCGGSGETWQPGEDSSSDSDGGGEPQFSTKKEVVTCGQGGWKCRSACDGKDYNFTSSNGKPGIGEVTQNPDGTHNENWTGASIGSVSHPCNCSKIIIKKTPIPGTGGGSGGGSSGSMGECSSCGGAGGSSSTIHHMPSEPPSTISTIATTGIKDNHLDGNTIPFETKTVTFDLNTTEQTPNDAGCTHVWTKEGDVTVKWTINAGEDIGKKDVETTINGTTTDKIVVDVLPACNLKLQYVLPGGAYTGDSEVITSFMVQNWNDQLGLNIRPKHKLSAKFTATDSEGRVLYTETRDNILAPKNKHSLIYFKWKVPNDLKYTDKKGKNQLPYSEINLKCEINTGYIKNKKGVNEENYADNTIEATQTVLKWYVAETFEVTTFEDKPPKEVDIKDNYYNKKNVRQYNDIVTSEKPRSSLSWSEWGWKNDWYEIKEYTAELETSGKMGLDPTTMSKDVLNPKGKKFNEDNLWATRSGYGVTLDFNANITFKGAAPPKSAYTEIQSANCYFPENNYELGRCNWKSRQWDTSKYRSDFHRSLDWMDSTNDGLSSSFQFYPNRFSFYMDKDREVVADGRRIHFTPLWYPDTKRTGGDRSDYVKSGKYMPYTVNVLSFDTWTPAGMLSELNTDILGIEMRGSVMDDWVYTEETNYNKLSFDD